MAKSSARDGFRKIEGYLPHVFFENKGEEFHGKVKAFIKKEGEVEIKAVGFSDSTCKAGSEGKRTAIENDGHYLIGGAVASKFADELAIGQEFLLVYNGKVKTKSGRTVNDIELFVK